MRMVVGMAARPTPLSDHFGVCCRIRCARLPLPLALSLLGASLAIYIRQVGVAARAVRAHHNKLHLLKQRSVQNDGKWAEEPGWAKDSLSKFINVLDWHCRSAAFGCALSSFSALLLIVIRLFNCSEATQFWWHHHHHHNHHHYEKKVSNSSRIHVRGARLRYPKGNRIQEESSVIWGAR